MLNYNNYYAILCLINIFSYKQIRAESENEAT